MMLSRKAIAHILLFLVNLFYGANFIISKTLMPEFILPQAFIFIRVSITVLLFFAVDFFWVNEKIKRKDIPLLIGCALFGVVINQEMFYAGLNLTTPINGALIMITTPILVMVISFFIKHEQPTWYKIAGILFGATGAFLIISGKQFNFSSETMLGDIFILLNAASYALYLVMVRPLMKKYHPMTVIKWVFLFGLLPVIVLGWNQFHSIQWQTFTANAWLALAFVVIFVTFCAYLFNILALREVHSSVVGAYIYLQPILAAIISIAVGKDALSWNKVIAALFIFTGVFLVAFGQQFFKSKAIKEL
ncbi:MAG: DMT family transporter [Chitinophagales bacterium]|nr:DMT family transporter [Chitinophagales bacterium]